MADSIAARLAAVDVAQARSDASAAAHAALQVQVEAARLAAAADLGGLRAAQRAVVDGLLSLGGLVTIPGPGGTTLLVEPYRGGYVVQAIGDGTLPIDAGGVGLPARIVALPVGD